MDKKNSFKKSLLSSAIIAATLQTLSAASQAGTCPAPNASGNVYVGVGDFCEGGMTVDAGFGPVNDIGIQGRVNGDVLVDDGISDFWMSAGELNGSFINNAVIRDINIDNGANVFSDIQNNGDMRFLTVSDDPGVPTVIHGNISNDGNIVRVHITGSRTLVKGNVVSSASATLSQDLLIDKGARVEGNITNHGSMGEIRVDSAHIGGDLTNTADGNGVAVNNGATVGGTFRNEGNVWGVGTLDGSTVAGDFLNSGDIFVFSTANDATVEGNMVNTGNAVFTYVGDGSHVAGDFTNQGVVVDTIRVDGASVTGSVVNGVDGYTDGLLVMDGSSAGAVLNEGAMGYLAITSSDIGRDVTNNGSIGTVHVANGSTIGGNLVNNGSIKPGGTESLFGPLMNGRNMLAGIEVTNTSAVAGDVVNNGDITLDYTVEPLPDGFTPVSPSLVGISVNNGSHGGRIVNNGTITVTNGQVHDGPEFMDGAQVNGIEVTRGATAEGIVNDGMIVADTFGVLIDGTGSDGVTINGDVVNTANGGILSKDNGLFILNAEVAGNVKNEGLINSSEDNAIDIEGSVIDGSVINTGSLVTNDNFDVIDINSSNIAGGVLNTDTGNLSGEDAIDIDDSMVTGTVENAGTINAVDEGFDIDQSDFGADLINSGLINAGRIGLYVEGEETDTEDPVPVIDYTTIGGSFINTGDIVSGETGIYMHYVDIAGDFDSSGSIQAGPQDTLSDGSMDFHGIDLDQVKVGNNVVLGDVSASGYGVRVHGATVGGHVMGNGTITGIQGDALFISGTGITGSLINQGVLSAGDDGIDLSDTTVGGDFTNSGHITAGDGSGIAMRNTISVSGSVNNAGNITADDVGIILEGKRFLDEGNQQVTEHIAEIGGDFINSGDIVTATNMGIHIVDASIGGKFHNTGDIATNNKYAINIEGSSQIGGDVFNSGELTGNKGIRLKGGAQLEGGQLVGGEVVTVAGVVVNEGTINSSNDAIRVVGAEIGGLVNAGDIDNTGSDAIDIDDAIINGNIENRGVLNVSERFSGDGIDIDQSIVKGSVINHGTLTINGTEGFDIEDTLIEGDVGNAADGVINARSDGFYIENTHIKGSLINNGTIVAKEHDGIDVQVDDMDEDEIRTRIDGSLVSTGNITAGDNGFELDGEWDGGDTIETPDGTVIVPIDVAKLDIGGAFYNSGEVVAKDSGIDLELVSVGAGGVLEDGQANFENQGMITAHEDAAIKLTASDVAGDFINKGRLSVVDNTQYSAGDQYRFQTDNASPEGEVTLTSVGTDAEGNTWFRIKNEGTVWTPVTLTEQGGDFDSGFIPVNSGEEVYITVGKNTDGSQSYVLSQPEEGPSGPPTADGILAVATPDPGTDFQPPYKIDSDADEQRGISLTGKLYGEGEEYEQLIKTTIGGSFKNTGTISAINEGIYLKQVDVGGSFVSEGDIESFKASAIDLRDVTVGGHFINNGSLNAGQNYISKEGDSYTEQWSGTPSEDGQVVLESRGIDENGNQWVVVRNEGDSDKTFVLGETAGEFATRDFTVESGEAVYVNVGELEGDIELKSYKGDVVATTGGNEDDFSHVSGPRHGISVVDADIGGHFINRGNITATDEGISLNNVAIGGQIENTGEITSEGTGIVVAASEVDGGVFNNSAINAVHVGIDIDNTRLSGSVVNGVDGVIIVERSEDGRTMGIELDGVEGVGDFVNHGTITLLGDGWGGGMVASEVSMDGAVGNTGTINSSSYGIALFHVDGATGLVNEGTINARIPGLFAVDSSIDGDIVNHAGAEINTDYDGIFLSNVGDAHNLVNHGTMNVAMGDGMTVFDTDFTGSVVNTGAITAGRGGISLFDLSADNVINSGTITAGTFEPPVDGEGPFPPPPPGALKPRGNGLTLVQVDLEGVIKNEDDGVINAASNGISLIDGSTHELINTGSVTAGDHGLLIGGGTHVDGNVYNDGSVTAGVDAIHVVDATMGKMHDGESVAETGYIINDSKGVIVADDDGIRVKRSMLAGGIENHGAIDAEENGIDIDDARLGGHIVNAGSIAAGTTAIDMGGEDSDGIVYVNGKVANYGAITAGHSGIVAEGVELDGDVLNAGTITADGIVDGMTAGIGLTRVKGMGNLINNGGIHAGKAGGAGNIAFGMGIKDSAMNGNIENNGVVLASGYGIAIDNVEGVDRVINRGTVQTSARGVYIVNTELAGDIENQADGEIYSRNSALYVENAEAGNLTNSGTIEVSEGHGIKVIDTVLNGNMKNSGTVNAGHHGISLDTVEVGSVVNTGSILAGFANPEGNGLEINNSTLDGEVANGEDGTIKANAHGMVVTDTDGVTDFYNAGTLEAGAHGMVASTVQMDGDVTNSGIIRTQGVDGEPFTVAMGVLNTEGVGSLTNSGTIDAGLAGGEANNALGMAASHVMMDGAVTNTTDGVITSSGAGMYLDHVDGVTQVMNQGQLDTDHRGIALMHTSVAGEFANNGTLDSRYSGLFATDSEVGSVANRSQLTVMEGHGIKLINTTVAGAVTNSGVLAAGHHGISLDNVTAAGSLTNTGSITAGTHLAEGNGIEVDNSTLDGGMVNAAGADIKASASGMLVSNSTLEGEVKNAGTLITEGVKDVTAGLGLQNVSGVTDFSNTGDITAGQAGGEGNLAFGMAAMNVDMAGEVLNSGSITSSSYGVYLDQVRGATRLVNEGSLSASQSRGMSVNNTVVAGELSNSGSIDSRNSGIYLENSAAGYLNNSGTINVTEGHGIKVIGGGFAGGLTNDTDGTVSAGHHGISLDRATFLSGNLLNRGTITAGTANAEGNGMEAIDSIINGLVANEEGASINAAAGGIVLDNTSGVTNVVNAGTIKGGTVGITVANTAVSGVIQNTGTVSGGAFKDVISQGETSRNVETSQLAFDLRTQANAVKLENAGIINGDILGRTLGNELDDRLTLAGGELNGDVHDIEQTHVTGSITLNNTFYSFNNSSTLTVTETGTLQMGHVNSVSVQGSYQQEGKLVFDVDEASRPFTQAIVGVTDVAEITDDSVFEMSLKNNDLRSLNPQDGTGRDIVLVAADKGATVNGDAVTITDNTILLNTLVDQRDSGRQVVANVSVADTGLLAADGGADVNAQNAIRALQATNSQGLIELYDLNRALYDQLFEGTATDFAAFAEQLVASPETGIAAGQSAQAEAVNTILTRIAELRTGASGISAGDDDDEGSNIRPDSLWIRAIYSDGKQDATYHNGNDFNEYSLRSSGFTLGADKDVSDTLTLGVGVTLANSTANERGSRQGANSETKTLLGSVYAGWRDQDYFADASVSVGKGDTDLKSTDWEADYDSTQIGISALAGKSILFNNNDTLVEPRLGLNYTRLKSDKYSYQGDTGTETIGSQNLETLELGAGVRFVTGIEMGDALLLPEASLMAWHDFNADGIEVDVAFETGGGSFTYFGPETEKTRYQAGVGAEYLMDNNFSVSVNYEYNWQDGFKADTLVAKLRYDF